MIKFHQAGFNGECPSCHKKSDFLSVCLDLGGIHQERRRFSLEHDPAIPVPSKAAAVACGVLLWIGMIFPASPVSAGVEGKFPDLTANVFCPLNADQNDFSIWPNARSSGNSDPWIWQNHEKIRKMRPRVLVLNFANNVTMEGIQDRTEKMIRALAEASRYHGYKDPEAPAFLEYQVLKYVDLRDSPIPPDRKDRNSTRCPYVSPKKPSACDYGAFFTEEFAKYYGFPDPKRDGKFLDLHKLIGRGIVHELWFYQIHDDWGAPLETIEFKQYYDMSCRPVKGCRGPAGNGHSETMPWSGRSFRITFFNPHRGIGCGMENFSHAMEGMANYNAIEYYRKYFDEYAEFDLDQRFSLPFKSLYAAVHGDVKVDYPDATTMRIRGEKEHVIRPYVAMGCNVHFPPGARQHYDLKSPFTVKSTIENWRLRNGVGGNDLVQDFNKDKFKSWITFCPDGMGPWLVFWRQNMPGLDNRCKDNEGRPMKNWWVFLFY